MLEETTLEETTLQESYPRREKFEALARVYAETHVVEWNFTAREDFTADMLDMFDQAQDEGQV